MPRAPLGPLPQPQDYELPQPRPYVRDLYYYRGNFCGLHYADAPVVPGCNDQRPDCVMAALLCNYPREFQDRYLHDYAAAGYTHLQRSIGHSLFYGHSLADHVELSQRAKRFGIGCDEWFLGAEAFNVRDQTWGYWSSVIGPIIDQLVGAGVVDTACVGWQLDQFNAPGNPIISIIAGVAERLPQSVPLYTHWVNEALAWWKTGGEVWSDRYQTIDVHDRFSWWLAMQPYLTGGHHQGDTQMARTNLKLYQDKMRDTTEPFADGRMGRSQRNGRNAPFLLTAFESTAQEQFDEVGAYGKGSSYGGCTELEGDMVGYVLSAVATGGYGNGARNPDGSAR